MSLKFILSATAYAALDDTAKAMYAADGDSFKLNVTGIPKPAVDTSKDAELKTLQDQVAKLTGEAGTAVEDALKKAGDIDALEKSWTAKLAAQTEASNVVLATRDSFIQAQLVDNVALSIATQIAASAEDAQVLMPHIKSRLGSDLTGDAPKTTFLDAKGALSALTMEEFSASFVANPVFSRNIKGSSADGGGSSGGRGGDSGAAPTALSDFKTGTEEALFANKNPEKYQAMVEAGA